MTTEQRNAIEAARSARREVDRLLALRDAAWNRYVIARSCGRRTSRAATTKLGNRASMTTWRLNLALDECQRLGVPESAVANLRIVV